MGLTHPKLGYYIMDVMGAERAFPPEEGNGTLPGFVTTRLAENALTGEKWPCLSMSFIVKPATSC